MAFASLSIDLDARLASFEQNLRRATGVATAQASSIEKAFGAVKTTLATLGVGIGVSFLSGFVRDLVASTAELDDFAEKTGASVEELSRLQQVLKLTGGDQALLESSLIKLNKSLQSVGPESQDARNAIAALGLNFDALARQSPAQALEDIAKRLATFQDGAEKSALATALLGRSGAQLLPFLKDLVQYGGLAGKVTAEQAAAAENLQNELRRFSLESENFKQAILLNYLGPITDLLEQFRNGIGIAGGFFEALRLFGLSNPLRSATDNIRELRGELVGLEKDKARQLRSGPVDVSGIDQAIASVQKQIQFQEVLKKQQDRTALAAEGINFRDVVSGDKNRTLDFKLGVKPVPGTGLSGIKEQGDAELKLARANADALLVVEREINQQRLAILDQYQGAAQISLSDYYATRAGINRDALGQELKDIDAQLTAERQRIEQAKADLVALGTQGTEGGAANKNKIATDKTIADSTARIIKLNAERLKTEIAASGQSIALDFQKKAAVQQLESAVVSLNVQLAQARGNTVDAATLQFDQANRQLREALAVNANAGSPDAARGLAALDALRAQTLQQAEFNTARQAYEDINARLAISEERIAIAQSRGALSELDALRATGNERARAVVLLREQLAALEAIAAVSDNKSLALAVEQTRVQIERLAASTDVFGDKFRGIFTDAVVSPLADFIAGTKSAKDAFADFAKSVVRNIAEIQAKALAQGIAGSASGGGAGGLLGSLFGSLFGGGGGGATFSGSPNTLTSGFTAFAQGGSFTVGGSGGTDSQLVAFRASPNERVTVQTPAQQRQGGGGGVTVNLYPTIDARGADAGAVTRIEAGLRQLRDSVVPMVVDAVRRNAGARAALRA